MKSTHFQSCPRCVMDSSASNFILYQNGTCNFCNAFLLSPNRILTSNIPSSSTNMFEWILSQRSADSDYDCVIGVSGGVDSSWVLHLAVSHGLCPLVVHFDNCWNSGLASSNVRRIVDKLGVRLHTYVVNYEDFDKALLALVNADVPDLELLTDHLLISINHLFAYKYNIPFILSGDNLATEGVLMPTNWNWFKYDFVNIRAILASRCLYNLDLPLLSFRRLVKYRLFSRIRWLSPLNTVLYNKQSAIRTLSELYDYTPYPYKHYESVLTRFYQGFILPQKGGIDKRKVHLSTLVLTGQVSRESARKSLESSPYPDDIEFNSDLLFFLDKLGLDLASFTEYLERPFLPHDSYSSLMSYWKPIKFVRNKLRLAI